MKNKLGLSQQESFWYDLMDGDHNVIFGITCVALAIGVYILFGPRPSGRKKVPVLGLQNLGQTCFVNTILQALGSCPIFIEWLESQTLGDVGTELRTVLLKLGLVPCKDNHEYMLQPLDLLQCLSQHGWRINLYDNLQQDAHELLVFVLSKIEDEIFLIIKNKRNGGLDCIGDKESCLDDGTAQSVSPSSGDASLHARRKKSLSVNNKVNMQTNCATPFRGRLVSQIRCMACGHENALKYDNFDSLSLHLPADPVMGGYTLSHLLEEFVKTEIIQDFECDKCNKQKPVSTEDETSSTGGGGGVCPEPKVLSDAVKTLRIGKLPQCLCLHIHRTFYSSRGTYKRQDYVDFPEYLSMEEYTYNAVLREKLMKKEMVYLSQHTNGVIPEHSTRELKNTKASNVYRLKAVVVHRGSAEHGHFVTYRRGPLHSLTRHRCSLSCSVPQTSYDSRWYFTSDGDVRDASLAEAMKSVAYMLFYEKCSSLLVNGVVSEKEVSCASSNSKPLNGHCIT